MPNLIGADFTGALRGRFPTLSEIRLAVVIYGKYTMLLSDETKRTRNIPLK